MAFKEAFGGSHEVVGIWGTAKAFDPPLIAKSISQNVTREPRYDDEILIRAHAQGLFFPRNLPQNFFEGLPALCGQRSSLKMGFSENEFQKVL